MSYTRKALATRSRILDAATALMLSNGLSRTKLADVLSRSRVQKGNFYYYFASKDDMGIAVLRERGIPLVNEWLELTCAGEDDPWERIQCLVHKLGTPFSLSGKWSNPVTGLLMELARVNGELKQAVGDVLSEARNWLTEQFKRLREAGRLDQSIDPAQLSVFLLCVVHGAVMDYHYSVDRETLQRTVQMGLDHTKAFVRIA